ncbi:hypothetical protein O7627_29855 [Solwaraspora sp. WMMD1047]|uniref:hypothetical protein n=1 Tax=Solwaraspora sp. WMMD1047 TaxID=3016102 RepID=UPI002416406E|nr:hypothetical protein [Solwaraspora sp. WMMD1047]MDG4833482.1 hypothetical protein [Solwaraspora sp. WMMD1047]
MMRSIRHSRWVALLVGGVATTAGLMLSGCSAGQIAETANKVPSAQGVNAETANGEYAIRGLLLAFPGLDGYEAGDNAIMNVVIYNDSPSPVTVTVTSQDAREVVIANAEPAAGTAVSPTEIPLTTPPPAGTDSPRPDARPTGSPSPSPSARPARVQIPPLGHVQLNTEAEQVLQLVGLDESLRSGQNAFVTFDFGNGYTVTAPAPVAVPLSPAGPPSQIIEREDGSP